MKLYYGKGSCSLGIHILLEDIGKPFDLHSVALQQGEQYQPPFAHMNAKSKVPTLERDDGSILTEFGAQVVWLHRMNPDAHILPSDIEAEARAIEAMDYIVGTLHMQCFARIFRPANFTPNEADADAVKARGREMFTKGLENIEHRLEGREYLAGPYSAADAALFYVCGWTKRVDIALSPNVAAHFARMLQRPAVQRALASEGLSF